MKLEKLGRLAALPRQVVELSVLPQSAPDLSCAVRTEESRIARKAQGAGLKKICLAAGGAAAVLAAVHLAGRYKFYQSAVSGELKRQLKTVNEKLDYLSEQNEALRAELRRTRESEKTAGAAR